MTIGSRTALCWEDVVACDICCAIVINEHLDAHRKWHFTMTNLPMDVPPPLPEMTP